VYKVGNENRDQFINSDPEDIASYVGGEPISGHYVPLTNDGHSGHWCGL